MSVKPNNKYWRDNDIFNKLMVLTVDLHESVYGDQGVLNVLFKDLWYKLPLTYNLQVGSDVQERLKGNLGWYDLFNGIPRVIHYTYIYKPWLMDNLTRFKEAWWFYYGMPWDKIILNEIRIYDSFNSLIDVPKYHAVIYTNTQNLHEIETLVKRLPNVCFHVLAPSFFGQKIVVLEKYMNVFLYPCFDTLKDKEVFNNMDIYLDINHEGEVDNIIERVHKAGKPVYSFECTNHGTTSRKRTHKIDKF